MWAISCLMEGAIATNARASGAMGGRSVAARVVRRVNVAARLVSPPPPPPPKNFWFKYSRVSDPSDRGQGLSGFDFD